MIVSCVLLVCLHSPHLTLLMQGVSICKLSDPMSHMQSFVPYLCNYVFIYCRSICILYINAACCFPFKRKNQDKSLHTIWSEFYPNNCGYHANVCNVCLMHIEYNLYICISLYIRLSLAVTSILVAITSTSKSYGCIIHCKKYSHFH